LSIGFHATVIRGSGNTTPESGRADGDAERDQALGPQPRDRRRVLQRDAARERRRAVLLPEALRADRVLEADRDAAQPRRRVTAAPLPEPPVCGAGLRPFVWTKTSDEILESIARYCERINESRHQLQFLSRLLTRVRAGVVSGCGRGCTAGR
jgi:hypothetical protein